MNFYEQYYSTKEMGEILGVTKPTILDFGLRFNLKFKDGKWDMYHFLSIFNLENKEIIRIKDALKLIGVTSSQQVPELKRIRVSMHVVYCYMDDVIEFRYAFNKEKCDQCSKKITSNKYSLVLDDGSKLKFCSSKCYEQATVSLRGDIEKEKNAILSIAINSKLVNKMAKTQSGYSTEIEKALTFYFDALELLKD